MFLAKTVDISNLEINYDYKTTIKEVTTGTFNNETKKIVNDFSKNDFLMITMLNGNQYRIRVMQSDIESICINLDDGFSLTRLNSGSKDDKYAAHLQVVGANDEKYNIKDKKIEIKGRGNTTWNLAKKPYQIKFDKKEELLGINGKSKKWILLANQIDRTLMRNQMMNDAQKAIGASTVINSKCVDLYINGEYLGNYIICDKADIGTNRIDLQNPQGVVCEVDGAYGWKEPYYFYSSTKRNLITLKESVADDETEEQAQAFKSFEQSYNKLEKLIYQKNPNWDQISELIDVDSFVKYYFLAELAEDPDRFITSTFLYQDGPDDVIHIGPLWDSDTALGYHSYTAAGSNTNVDYVLNMEKFRGGDNNFYRQLYKCKEFSTLLQQAYQNNVKSVFNALTTKLELYKQSMQKSVEMNYIRWKLLGTTPELVTSHPQSSTYEGEVNYLKKWVNNRVNYLNERYSSNTQVEYTTYVDGINYDDRWLKDGETAGTTGRNLAIQETKIILPNSSENQHISYSVHTENYGWLDWKKDGQSAGIRGLKTEAIKIKLEGMDEYNVSYRVHVQDLGWTGWVSNGEEAGTTGQNKKIEAVEVKIEKHKCLGNEEVSQDSKIEYSAHLSNIGWTGKGGSGETIGTTGEARKVEAVKINLKDIEDENIQYRTHVENIGWQDWVQDGEIAGTSGKGLRVEAIQLKISNTNKYRLRYRAYVQDIGWQDWKENGEIAGTTGERKQIEAIEIEFYQKKYLGEETKNPESEINYAAHLANIGWTGYVKNNEIIGTMGEARQMEAFKLELNESLGVTAQCQAHVENIGWMNWTESGEIVGTEGKGQQLEAVKIKLSDTTNYNIKYRAYVENIGWMSWVENGEIAGTMGMNYQIEALQIKLEIKNN